MLRRTGSTNAKQSTSVVVTVSMAAQKELYVMLVSLNAADTVKSLIARSEVRQAGVSWGVKW